MGEKRQKRGMYTLALPAPWSVTSLPPRYLLMGPGSDSPELPSLHTLNMKHMFPHPALSSGVPGHQAHLGTCPGWLLLCSGVERGINKWARGVILMKTLSAKDVQHLERVSAT